jgi:hypothetical protein
MCEYDIWVLNNNRMPSVMVPTLVPGDVEAIRIAREITGGRPFEVWGDAGCIYYAEENPNGDLYCNANA